MKVWTAFQTNLLNTTDILLLDSLHHDVPDCNEHNSIEHNMILEM